jgi:CelD/BcsL family acetyltransferase involved in cellulose biosynthesis
VANAVWEHLREWRYWDQLVFNDVLQGSLILTAFRRILASEGIPVNLEKVGIRYSLALPRTWQEYIAGLDDGAAKRLPYKRRKFERAGRVEYRRITRPEELDQAFDELIRLHTKRWKARGRDGVFANPRFTEYHRRLARTLLPQGLLNLGLLSLDGVNIAAHYNLRYAGTEYFYQGGADVELASKYSPGVIAHVYAIEAAILDGLNRYDFMKGGTDSYKTEFGCDESPMHNVRVFAKTFRGRTLAVENWARGRWRAFRRGRKHANGAGTTTPE